MEWLEALRAQVRKHVDLDALLRQIVDEATRRLRADRGTLYLVDHARKELVSRVAHLPEISEIRLRIGEGIAGCVARDGALLNVGSQDPRHTSRVDALTGYTTRSLLAVPVRGSQDTVIAVLQLLNKRGGDFGAEDERLLSILAVDVAELLEESGLASQLRPGQVQPLSFRYNHIVGESAAMQLIYERVQRSAPTNATVLLRGETGSGKTLVARAIHENSRRAGGPFVQVDCAALPGNLIENELFGHVRGAFTGADRDTDGKVAAASEGTLFLDEVGELPLALQGRLLRLLQDRTYLKVGGNRPVAADVRFVCATNRPLEQLVDEGSFRQDLYYRLRVVEIAVPPLRSRGHGDIDRLVDYFLHEFARRHQVPERRLTPDARSRLHAHPWPGNVRELEHVIESAVVLAPSEVIEADQLRLAPLQPVPMFEGMGDRLRPLAEVELDYIRHVLDRVDGNRTQAARVLGIGRNTLNRKLK